MGQQQAVDYDALAAKHGAVQTPSPALDYDALAAKHGSVSSAAEEPQQQGFLDSLKAGLPGYHEDDSFGAIKDIGSGLYHIFSHPVDSAQLLYHGTVDPMQLTTDDAIARMKKHGVMNKVNGAIEYAESGIPFLGPSLAKAGQQNEAGKWGAGAGTALTAAVPFVAPEALESGLAIPGKIWSRVSPARSIEQSLGRKLTAAEADTPRAGGQIQPALNNTPREVLQHAHDEGIQLTPGQGTEDALAQNLQKSGVTAASGGKELANAIAENKVKFGQAVNGFMDDLDPKRSGLSTESAGEAVKQSTQTAKQVAHDNASQGYQKIDYLMDHPVNGETISDAWKKIKVDLPLGAEDSILAQTPRSMRGVVEDLLSGKPEGFKPTVGQTIQLRKLFRDLGDTEGLPDKTQATYKKMEGASSSALDAAASDAGGAADWKSANAGWKDYVSKYGNRQSVLYKLLHQQDPVKAVTMLQNAPATDIALLKNEGMTAAIEPLKRQVVQDIARSRFNVAHDGLGGYSDAYLKALFEPAEVKELYLKADLANRLKYDPNPSGTAAGLQSLEQLKIGNQAKMAVAARLSMPRDALSFLPGKAPVYSMPGARPTLFPSSAATSPLTGGALASPAQLFKTDQRTGTDQ